MQRLTGGGHLGTPAGPTPKGLGLHFILVSSKSFLVPLVIFSVAVNFRGFYALNYALS